jgi:hypothetical protein
MKNEIVNGNAVRYHITAEGTYSYIPFDENMTFTFRPSDALLSIRNWTKNSNLPLILLGVAWKTVDAIFYPTNECFYLLNSSAYLYYLFKFDKGINNPADTYAVRVMDDIFSVIYSNDSEDNILISDIKLDVTNAPYRKLPMPLSQQKQISIDYVNSFSGVPSSICLAETNEKGGFQFTQDYYGMNKRRFLSTPPQYLIYFGRISEGIPIGWVLFMNSRSGKVISAKMNQLKMSNFRFPSLSLSASAADESAMNFIVNTVAEERGVSSAQISVTTISLRTPRTPFYIVHPDYRNNIGGHSVFIAWAVSVLYHVAGDVIDGEDAWYQNDVSVSAGEGTTSSLFPPRSILSQDPYLGVSNINLKTKVKTIKAKKTRQDILTLPVTINNLDHDDHSLRAIQMKKNDNIFLDVNIFYLDILKGIVTHKKSSDTINILSNGCNIILDIKKKKLLNVKNIVFDNYLYLFHDNHIYVNCKFLKNILECKIQKDPKYSEGQKVNVHFLGKHKKLVRKARADC